MYKFCHQSGIHNERHHERICIYRILTGVKIAITSIMPLWSRPSGIGIRQQYLLENAPPADPELARLATANITCGGYHVESVIAGKSKPENFGIRQTFVSTILVIKSVTYRWQTA